MTVSTAWPSGLTGPKFCQGVVWPPPLVRKPVFAFFFVFLLSKSDRRDGDKFIEVDPKEVMRERFVEVLSQIF